MRKFIIASLLAATALVSTAAYAQEAGDTPTPPDATQPDSTPPDITPVSDPIPPSAPVEPVTTKGMYRTCIGGFWTYVQTNSDDSISYYPGSEPCTSPPDDGTGLTIPVTEDLPVDSSSFVEVPGGSLSPSPPPPPGPSAAGSKPAAPPPSKGQHFSGPDGTQIFITPRGQIFVRFPPGTSYGSDLNGNVYIITKTGLKPITEVAYHPDGSRNAVIFTPDGHAISVGPNGQLFVGTNPQDGQPYTPSTNVKTDTPPKDGGSTQKPLKTALPHLDDTPSFVNKDGGDEHPVKSALLQHSDDAPKSMHRSLRSHFTEHDSGLERHAARTVGHVSRTVENKERHARLSSAKISREHLADSRPFKGRLAGMSEMHRQNDTRGAFRMSMAGPVGGHMMGSGLEHASGLGGMHEMRPMSGSGGMSMMHGGGVGGLGGMRFGRF